MAKKLFHVGLDTRERTIIDLIRERDGISKAEAVRLCIRNAGPELGVLPPTKGTKAKERPGPSATGEAAAH
jgi:hypothetical protein